MMTLEKFEEASELVKKVTNPTKLVFSEYLSDADGSKSISETGKYAAYRSIQDQGSLL